MYAEAHTAVDKLMANAWGKKLVFIIKTELVKSVEAHWSRQSWAPKQGKIEGRPCGNASAMGPNGHALNNDVVKCMVADRWGPIHNPSIVKIVRNILTMGDKHGFDNIAVWKMDLAGAFTLLNIKPSNVGLMMYEMMGGFTLIHLAGMFGWTGMPFAFQVVTRVVIALIGLAIVLTGLAEMFVDDVIAVSTKTSMAEDMEKSSRIITELLGEGAEEFKKRVSTLDEGNDSHEVDVVGWNVASIGMPGVTPTVGISRRNRRKMMFRVFDLDETHTHTHTVELVCSGVSISGVSLQWS